MEERFNEATANRPEGNRSVDAHLVMMNIPDVIKQIKKENA